MSREVFKKKIVVADDDEAILELVTIRLELAGYHTIAARNGYQALDRVRATAPDGMVLDIGLPQLDGFGVLNALKGFERKIPVLMLTARHAAEDVRKAIGLGASGYLAKPFDDKALLDRIARMIRPTVPAGHVWQV